MTLASTTSTYAPDTTTNNTSHQHVSCPHFSSHRVIHRINKDESWIPGEMTEDSKEIRHYCRDGEQTRDPRRMEHEQVRQGCE
ncbi:hypothetical protein Pmani_020288 [Petrolisthes manimaculis]|uniref:Uncharacterized protein n=1 Tax=Petrolisthes manimaculis TaxID=1843537 RepID=A0AAE1PGX7_9EUCA|nr:hypothetical protein Pmani_020288 [Petrolisthes manimaculis]